MSICNKRRQEQLDDLIFSFDDFSDVLNDRIKFGSEWLIRSCFVFVLMVSL